MTPAKAGQRGTIIFDDFDNGLVVQSLTLSADVKIGDGSEAPEGGFSVSFVRRNDPVMVNQDGTGFSGIAGETDLPEEGTITGLSIGFDASQTGSLVATNNGAVDGDARYDVIGISVRVDNELLFQAPLRTLNGEGTNVNSLQTGPRDLTNPGSGSLLTWQPLKIELTDAGNVSVWWKGIQVITNLPTQCLPSRSRVVFGGRTGTNYQFQAVDNVQIATMGPGKTSVDLIALDAFGLTVKLADAGTVWVMTNTIVLKFNGETVTPTSMAKEEQVTTIRYNAPDLLPPGAKYPVEISYVDRLDRTNKVLQTLTVPKYLVIPPAFAIPATNVDKTKPGFRVRPHQVASGQPNSITWTEEQLLGLHGANLADLSGADATGYYNRASVIAFAADYTANFAGDSFFSEVGLPGPSLTKMDNSAMDILTFLEFPSTGVYTLGVNSNDGYRLATAANNKDVAAAVLAQSDYIAKATLTLAVPQAGIYPFRLVWENRSTGAQLEWYSVDADGDKILINDISTSRAIKAYRSASQPVYLSSATPLPAATSVRANTDIVLTLTDGDLKPLDAATLVLQLNGTTLPVSLSKTGTVTTVTSSSPLLLPGGLVNTLALTFGDTSIPAKVYTNTWTFTTVKPSVKYSVAGGKYTVTFVGMLQAADTVNGTYQDLVGTNSPAIFNIGESNRFFRARGN